MSTAAGPVIGRRGQGRRRQALWGDANRRASGLGARTPAPARYRLVREAASLSESEDPADAAVLL
ncbi:Hypothetical protein MexAM1_META1p2672 [Methylorubrum extorquens AM1]|uniref:Uncharacterized protein n=1 Tax=Methylorubrum extorquens (strain ATCC 14718 / DSM 1338 / JCM 2805 / NCIMB 9133 / AM1) TaxID=272630 RepID=C5ASJ9_METEA|nr:Hypothetical protein MexAM1_META1p2672 [Methylorubrum extorquens AM1]